MDKNTPQPIPKFNVVLTDKQTGQVIVNKDFDTGIICFNTSDYESESFSVENRIFGRHEPVVATLNAIVARINMFTPLIAFLNKKSSNLPVFDLQINHAKKA